MTITWGNNQEHPYEWSFPDPVSYERIRGIVPVIGISGTGSADVNTARFAELAASLGADVETPELLAARADYEESVAAFKALAAEKSDLTTLFVYADGQFEYVAYPPDWADRSCPAPGTSPRSRNRPSSTASCWSSWPRKMPVLGAHSGEQSPSLPPHRFKRLADADVDLAPK